MTSLFAYQRKIIGDAKYNIGSINGIFKDNDVAIYISGQKVGSINGIFIGNKGAVQNAWGRPTIDSVTGYFEANSKRAITNGQSATLHNISGTFINNNLANTDSNASGGAIYNTGTLGTITNSTFTGNYAKTESGIALGGAIYTAKDLQIVADNHQSVFRGNYTEENGKRDDNAIYANSGAAVNFTVKNNGRIEMYDNIRGASVEVTETDEDGNEIKYIKNYSVNITGDNTGTFGLYNDIYDANVTIGNTNLSTVNNLTHTYNFNSLSLTGDVNANVDVDLKNKSMDRLVADSYGTHAGNINVTGMNLLSDAAEGEKVTAVYFAEPGLKDNVTNGVSEIPNSSYQTSVYTPIYKYNVKYDTTTDYGKGDGGYFLFTKGDRIFTDNNGGGTTTTPSGNPSDAFNPSVLSAPISSVASSQATLNETFKYVFEHADTFTKMPELDRMAKINANKYAISTDFNHNLGSLCPEHNNKAGWYKPYVTFEKMDLKNGPKVNATTYGSLAGFDTDFFEHKNGWHSVGTGYVGYNGSQLRYKGIDTTMNGGILGYTHTMYKGNFWSALTLSAGASVGQSNTMYGKEDFTSLLAGVGSKTGYNFEFKEGKYILQPIMILSYTFVNTFDYTNAAGVRINADPAHSIQLNPSIRFITNTKTGWQPYASVGMVWNVMNENKVTANDVRLPEMGMKPYVEYGVGVQKNWKDRFTAFGQAMLRNGGRTGIALSGGFRWALGHEGSPIKKQEKVEAPSTDKLTSATPEKKIIKQMSESQKLAHRKNIQNSTRTANTGVLKQL